MDTEQIESRQDEVNEQGEPEAAIASFEELMAAEDLEIEYVPLPAPYKGGVKVRPLTMSEMRRISKDATKGAGTKKAQFDLDDFNKRLLAAAVVAPQLTPDQVEALFTKNHQLMTAMMQAVNKVNRFVEDEEGQEEADRETAAEFQV